MKTCRTCEHSKAESLFSPRERLRPSGECKACACRRRYAWAARNRDKINARRRGGENRRFNLMQSYGITIDEWNRMFAAQGHRCAICHTDKPAGRGWATDHNHSTGSVRGILCHHCNAFLGYCRESPEALGSAIAYLCKHSGASAKYAITA